MPAIDATKRIGRLARRVYHMLGLSGYARLDLRLAPDGQIFVIEANATPDVAEDEVLAALRAHAYNLQAAADSLGISRPSLYKLMKKSSRIRTARDLGIEEIQGCRKRFAADLDAMAEHLEVSRRALRRRMTELGFD